MAVTTGSMRAIAVATSIVAILATVPAGAQSLGSQSPGGQSSGHQSSGRQSPAIPSPVAQTRGHMITTGGDLDFGDRPTPPRRTRPARTAKSAAPEPANQSDWLYAFIDMLLDDDAQPVKKPRRLKPQSLAAPINPAPSIAAPLPAQPLPSKSLPAQAVVPAAVPNVITGAIDRPSPPSLLPPLNRDDLDATVVGDAEISQARQDLVKLELARRTYDEARLSGQSAFEQRLDWRVLERARDAWSDTEASAAIAAGFEANTYINDTTRTIVVAVAGTQDLRRDFLSADIWHALIQAQSPQHFFLAKSYIRSVQARYQADGYHTECVGHSLGGGACAYAASELGIRAIVVNPISAGRLGDLARHYVTNYVVDGDIAAAIYALRGNELSGDIQRIRHDRDAIRQQLRDRYGVLAGPIRVVRDLRNAVKVHQIERALDIIAAYADTQRVK